MIVLTFRGETFRNPGRLFRPFCVSFRSSHETSKDLRKPLVVDKHYLRLDDSSVGRKDLYRERTKSLRLGTSPVHGSTTPKSRCSPLRQGVPQEFRNSSRSLGVRRTPRDQTGPSQRRNRVQDVSSPVVRRPTGSFLVEGEGGLNRRGLSPMKSSWVNL